MSSICLAEPDSRTLSTIDTTSGQSGDSNILKEFLDNILGDINRNARFELKLEALDKAYLEAAEDDWNGYGARATTKGTYVKAFNIISLLPANTPVPDISVDPDGEISFEWYVSKTNLLCISINENGRISFVRFYGKNKSTNK